MTDSDATLYERSCDLLEPHEPHEWNESDRDGAKFEARWLCPGIPEQPEAEVVDPMEQARAANEAQLAAAGIVEGDDEDALAGQVAVPARRTVMPLDADTAEGRIVSWARAANAAYHVGRMLATTDFISDSLKVKNGEPLEPDRVAQQVAAAILTGDEVGMRPMAALRSIAVIRGTPSMSALSIRALVRAAGHKLTYPVMRADRVVCRGQRRITGAFGHAFEPPVDVEWTFERARRLGLTTRRSTERNPNPWETQPLNMLVARATTEAARLVAPEVLLGIGYSSEELADMPVEAETAQRAATAAAGEPGTGVQRRRRAKPDDGAKDEPASKAEPATSGEPAGEGESA